MQQREQRGRFLLGSLGILRRTTQRVLRLLVPLPVIYVAMLLIGLWPINRHFRQADDGIDVYVYRDYWHSEIIVPVTHPLFDWHERLGSSQFGRSPDRMPYVALGWGDRRFFLQTPTWSDLEFGTTCRALLWPTDTVMHATFCYRPTRRAGMRHVRLSKQQYATLCDTLWNSFRRDAGDRVQQLPAAAYGNSDAFYHARGHYWLVNTCNNWTGRVLRRAGIRTGLWTPLPWGVAQVPESPET